MVSKATQIARFMGPTWGPCGSCWPQMGLLLAPWTFLSGILFSSNPTSTFLPTAPPFPSQNVPSHYLYIQYNMHIIMIWLAIYGVIITTAKQYSAFVVIPRCNKPPCLWTQVYATVSASGVIVVPSVIVRQVHCWRHGPSFISMDHLLSQHDWVITSAVKCGIKLLINSQTSTTLSLKFGKG